jgi:hypothetical protein
MCIVVVGFVALQLGFNFCGEHSWASLIDVMVV